MKREDIITSVKRLDFISRDIDDIRETLDDFNSVVFIGFICFLRTAESDDGLSNVSDSPASPQTASQVTMMLLPPHY